MNKRLFSGLLSLLLVLTLLAGCGESAGAPAETWTEASAAAAQTAPAETVVPETQAPEIRQPEETQAPQPETAEKAEPQQAFDLSRIPPFSGEPFLAVNGNQPYFQPEELTETSFEAYAPLDSLGRCGVTLASVGRDLMPTEERGSIGMVKPTGWHTVKYDCVDGKYLYNRCHLIGYQLTGENANTSNLITGTRYLNIEGMLPFENMVADYVKETGNHVMYRVTPIFEGDNLLAAGVLMEGLSVEDQGEGICYCVFAYNAQPGVNLNYATGESEAQYASEEVRPSEAAPEKPQAENAQAADYILNKNSKKFHLPDCPSVGRMKQSNKEYYSGSREDLIARGYDPCKNCNP